MRDAMTNLGIMEPVREALRRLNVDLGDLIDPNPTRRWAMAAWPARGVLHGVDGDGVIPAYGYGIRYANGMFRQEMSEGCRSNCPRTG